MFWRLRDVRWLGEFHRQFPDFVFKFVVIRCGRNINVRELRGYHLSLCLVSDVSGAKQINRRGCRERWDSMGSDRDLIMRAAIQRYDLSGAPISFAAGPLRNLSAPDSSTGEMKSYVTSTGALSVTETSVSRAYYGLFGRSPDLAGMSYWVAQLGAGATVAAAVDTIVAAVSGSLIFDPDPAVSVALIYHNLIGKEPVDDLAGQAYWTSAIKSGTTLGAVVSTIINAAFTLSGYPADQFRNRMLVLESICRLQKSQNYSLSVQDSRSAVLRVLGTADSYDAAMADIYRLLVARTASTPMTWGEVLSSSTLYARSRLYDYCSIRQVRNLVWYNRGGDMMLATVYLPPNFMSVENKAVVALHGGGWRQGYPEKIYGYCTALAADATPSRVVLSPTYRLTAYGHTSPAPEHDVADFYALVAARPAFLRMSTSAPCLFGESSGGHLACLLGATQDVPRVAAIYPPINLTGSPAVSDGLAPYVGYYASSAGDRAAASVDLRWTSARTTTFRVWHGLADAFVPAAQSSALKAAAGDKCTVTYKPGEGHGFTTSTMQEVIAGVKSFFDA